MYFIPLKLLLQAFPAEHKSLLSCLPLTASHLLYDHSQDEIPCVCNFSFLESFLLTALFITKGLLLPSIRPWGQQNQVSTRVWGNKKNTIGKDTACKRSAAGLYWESQSMGNE